jgi:hypothetical protein
MDFIRYILNVFAFFGFERNPLLCIEDKYTSPTKKKEYEHNADELV